MKRANVGLLEAAEAMEKCSFQPRKALQQLDSQKRAREQAEKAAQRELERTQADEAAADSSAKVCVCVFVSVCARSRVCAVLGLEARSGDTHYLRVLNVVDRMYQVDMDTHTHTHTHTHTISCPCMYICAYVLTNDWLHTHTYIHI